MLLIGFSSTYDGSFLNVLVTCVIICITLNRLSQPPKVNSLLTSETEYGTDATADVPSPALVENATPIEAMNSPVRNKA